MIKAIGHRLIQVIGVVLLAVFSLASITAEAATAEPIKIGVLAPEAHILGKAIVNAAQLAADEINAGGGINGHQVKLYTYNTNFSASEATRAFQRSVQQDGVSAVIGIFASEVALAVMPWAARLQTPLIITAAGSSEIPKRIAAQPDRFQYVFHGWVNSEILAEKSCIVARDVLLEDKRFKHLNRAVIFSEDANWTQPLVEAYRKCLPQAGFKVVDTINFSPDTTDFTPLFNRVEDHQGTVIMAALAHVGVQPTVQWRRQQVSAILAGVNAQASSSEFWNATNGETEGVITNNPGLSGAPITDVTPRFYEAYTKRFRVEQPAYTAYTTYDALYALKNAMEQTPGAHGDALVQALEKVDFTGTLGRIHFYSLQGKYPHEVVFNKDAEKGQSFLAFQWQQGKQVIIWPQRLATGKVELPSFVKP